MDATASKDALDALILGSKNSDEFFVMCMRTSECLDFYKHSGTAMQKWKHIKFKEPPGNIWRMTRGGISSRHVTDTHIHLTVGLHLEMKIPVLHKGYRKHASDKIVMIADSSERQKIVISRFDNTSLEISIVETFTNKTNDLKGLNMPQYVSIDGKHVKIGFPIEYNLESNFVEHKGVLFGIVSKTPMPTSSRPGTAKLTNVDLLWQGIICINVMSDSVSIVSSHHPLICHVAFLPRICITPWGHLICFLVNGPTIHLAVFDVSIPNMVTLVTTQQQVFPSSLIPPSIAFSGDGASGRAYCGATNSIYNIY